jgi:hypothetical protein
MAYIGIQPAEKFTSFATQEFSTSATTSYTLDHAVANENELALFVNNVRQQPGSGKAYTATGTALTLSAATASTDTMYCIFLGRALQTVVPATNSITTSMININGGELFLDADADTSITADTDDQIDFKTGGTDRAQIDSSGNFKFNSGFGSVATAYGVRAWIRFDGTGTVAIDASGNVSSITDSGVGTYEVNFTTNMPDANYAIAGNNPGNILSTAAQQFPVYVIENQATNTFRLSVRLVDNDAPTMAASDSNECFATILR